MSHRININPNLRFFNENNQIINHMHCEDNEQSLAYMYIKPNDCVLELGARYGTVSYAINLKLEDKTQHVAVEPDETVWNALEKNLNAYSCKTQIYKGFVSNKKLELLNDFVYGGYGKCARPNEKSLIPHATLKEINSMVKTKFNVMVVDCEGCLESFFDENPEILDDLRLIIFEADFPENCNYNKIKSLLKLKHFYCLQEGHQNVWEKKVI